MSEANPQVEPTTPEQNETQADPKESDLIPRSEAQKAFKARDLARRQVALLTRHLGISASDVVLKPTNRPDDPFELDSPVLNKLAEMSAGLQTDTSKKQASEISSLERFVANQLVEEKLRTALSKAGAIDPLNDGSYSDLIALLKGRVKATRTLDELGETSFDMEVFDPKGKPMAQGKGIDDVVQEFLSVRTHLRKANRRGGPGAGGAGQYRAGANTATSKDRANAAADYVFGSQNLTPAQKLAKSGGGPNGAAAADFMFKSGGHRL